MTTSQVPGDARVRSAGLRGVAVEFFHLALAGRARPAVVERLRQISGAESVADWRDVDARMRASAVCIVDLAGGREVLSAVRGLRSQHVHAAIVGVADDSNPLIAGEAWHAGILEILPWPFGEADLQLALTNAREAVCDPALPSGVRIADDLVFAQSAAMQRVLARLRDLAPQPVSVALIGEADTGRRLLTRVLHRLSAGAESRPLRVVECAGKRPDEIAGELFGDSGAGEGAVRSEAPVVRVGLGSALVDADGGTLVLCNVSDVPDRVQSRLARLLRDGEVLIGSARKTTSLRIRVVTVGEPTLDADLGEGRLRADLFARIGRVRIEVPPLRQRREDLPPLAAHLLHEACAVRHVAPKAFSRSALRVLMALPWRGNVAELAVMVDGVAQSVSGAVVQLDDLLERATLEGLSPRLDPGLTLREAKARFERDCIAAMILRHRGRMGEAARALGIQRTNLYRKVRQLKVHPASGPTRR